MKILITGATGFVGRNLMPKLLENGHEILEITIEQEISHKLYGDKGDHFLYKSENHQELVEKIKEFKPEIVIHLASYLTSSDSYLNLSKLIQANIIFLADILDTLKIVPPKLFINTGTFAEYFSNDDLLDPAYLYAATKTASRFLVKYYSKAYNFKYITVVPFSIYGINGSQNKLMDYLVDSLNSSEVINFTAGEQILDFIHVNDVANAFLCIAENYIKIYSGETFYAGTGKGLSIRELGMLIEKISGKKLNVKWGGLPYRVRDVMRAVAPLFKNNSKIPWKAFIEIESGIKERLEICK